MSPAKAVVSGQPPPQAASGTGFAALIGQDRIVGAVRSAIARERLPHALLLTGLPGVGKATLAGILAQALNCTALGPGDACGRCVSCQKVARGMHPDVVWVAPEPRTISIHVIRALNERVGYRPHEGRRRVVVIDDAEAMTPEAQNSFLKTLEEPPASSQLILVTPAPQRLLPTVRSRCQSLRFAPVPTPLVRSHLTETLGIDAAEARIRSALAPGSIGRAIAVDLDDYAEKLELVVAALRLASEGGAGIVAAAESLAGGGEGDTASQRATSTLLVARDVLRDLLVVASGGDRDTLVNTERELAWREWAAGLEVDAVAEALAAVSAGVERFAGGITPNVKMTFEGTLADVYRALSANAPAPVSRR